MAPKKQVKPAYNRLKLLEMDSKAFKRNRAELRKYLDRSTALRAEPAPIKAKRGDR